MSKDINSLETLCINTAKEFELHFGQTATWIVAAPGRVNIIGEHTDYNEGFVLPMAIDRYTVLAAARPSQNSADQKINWFCTKMRETAEIPLQKPVPKGEPAWSNYVRGVVEQFSKRGIHPGPLNVLMKSTVPMGGGLSSSAALEVATATLLEAVSGITLDPLEKALLCQKAEHEYAGVPCGIMDQFTATMAKENHLLLLDCRFIKADLVPVTESSVSVLIVNSNVKHQLVNGEYAKRKAQCEQAAKILGVKALRDATSSMLEAARDKMDPVVYRRARHVISENRRTLETADALKNSNWTSAGMLMYASHASLRNDYEVSCNELDVIVDIAHRIGPLNGMLGCRMTGGGFGGCAVCFAKTEAMEDISKIITTEYKSKTGITPSLFICRPASGATVFKM
jgi:galactokinase